MIRRCDDCGAEVRDTIGSRQCSLFDPPDARIDPTAAACIRSGRILCPACARGVPLLPEDSPAAVAIDLADGEADAADDGPGPTGAALVPLSSLQASLVRELLEPHGWKLRRFEGTTQTTVAWVEPIGVHGSTRYRDRLELARRCVAAAGGKLIAG